MVRRLIATVVFGWLLFSFAASLPAQELTLNLKLRQDEGKDLQTIDFDENFEVTIQNLSDEPVVIPDPFCATGVQALTFSIKDSATKQDFQVFRDASDWVDEPKTIKLSPGESHLFYISFSQDRWRKSKWQNLPSPAPQSTLSIQATYKTNELEGEFWKGEITSPQEAFEFVFGRADLPQVYLWNGFPDGALKMMKADPQLIHKTDDDSRTPLHVAARFGQVDIVKWLLENGADPNVAAYNGFTPLYMATMSARPEIFRMLLKAGADPDKKNAFGKTPLQVVVGNQVAQSKKQPGKPNRWGRILDEFLNGGVTLDLLSAIQLGKMELVKKQLQDDPRLLDKFQATQKPLRTAASSGQVEIAKYLLTEFSDQMDVDNFAGNNGYPVIKDALAHSELVQLLIDHDADLERKITWQGARTGVWLIGDNATLLHFAARDGSPDTIRTLLDHGVELLANARPDFGDSGEQTAIEVAATLGSTKNLRAMLEHKTFQRLDEAEQKRILNHCLQSVFTRSISPDTRRQMEMISVLVEVGADTSVKIGKLNLIQALTKRIHPYNDQQNQAIRKMVLQLQEMGLELDLFSAVSIRDTDSVIRLLAKDPSLSEARRADGYPAAHFAASMGDIEMVERLVESGCSIELRNHSRNAGHFAERMIHVAAFWNRPEVVEYLIQKGAKVNVISKGAHTPLHFAASMGSLQAVQLLLENGADVFAKDIGNRVPLTRATDPQIKKLLQRHMDKGVD